MAGKVLEITDALFESEVLQSSVPVLVDFWAPWCGPCRMIAPTIEALAKDHKGKVVFGKLNTDENQEVAQAYGIMSIPTLAVFKGGKVVDGIVGAAPKQMLKELLNKHAPARAAN